MTTTDRIDLFHEGERAAQKRAGVGDVAEWAGGYIRDYLPEQHRAFHAALPFLLAAGGDAEGRTWITMLEGPNGFATSPDPRQVRLETQLGVDDPLAASFNSGTEIGVLGIELATRRRNRFSGHVTPFGAGYGIDIRQTFGNCPQYIHERTCTRVETSPGVVQHSEALNADQIARITAADTLFIGSGHSGETGAASNGYDASHRGGAPGFVQVSGKTRLHIPDYAGNNFFNTIGNLVSNPQIGVLFIDFETGGLLHISGRATIDWDPQHSQDSGPQPNNDDDARRMINVEIDAIIDRPAAVSLRWTKQGHLSRRLRLAKRVKESTDITSFYFVAADGRPLDPFKAGQHLPIEVQIPGQKATSKRSYSLSGSPDERSFYRISVKREKQGLVSRFLHDQLREGSLIDAQKPSGSFAIPCSNCPLVLVSAGVGLTPMLSALHASADHDRPVWYVHGTRGSSDHALRDEVAELVRANPQASQHIAYSHPEASDVKGRDYHSHGRITADTLLALNAGSQAHYMLCGPAAFLADIRHGLEAKGIPAEHIHLETFGPAA